MLLASVALFGSCEDFLSKEDPNKIDAPSYFRNETDLQTYVNGFLQTMSPTAASVATGDARTDCLAWRGEYQFLTDNFDADDQSGWGTSDWEDLRNINYFLDNFRQAAVSETTLAHYEGVARFWRAYFYWNKVKTFGAVPWYDSTIDSNDHEALYKPRDSREYVMRKVLEDIEFASTYCTSSSALEVNSVQITRYIALALKARICLYEGTFRKYHANDPSTGKPWTADEAETYLRAAVSACNELMTSKKYSLVSDPANVSTQYRKLFTSESVFTQEVIWARVYNAELNATHNLNSNFIVQQYGSYSLTKQFINTYLNLDGSRFTDKPGYEKTAFIDEFENRDYRLMQTVRYPGYTRKNNGTDTRYAPDFGYCVTADQMGDRRHESRQQHLALLHVDPDYSLRRNPADLRRSEMRVGRIRRNSLERDDQTSARTRRCRRSDACYGRSLHDRIFPRYRHRQRIARNSPRTRLRIDIGKRPLGR